MRREQEEWQRRAELALTRGREDLAKGALAAKARHRRGARARGAPARPAGRRARQAERGHRQAAGEARRRQGAREGDRRAAQDRRLAHPAAHAVSMTSASPTPSPASSRSSARSTRWKAGSRRSSSAARPALADELRRDREGCARRGGAGRPEGAARQRIAPAVRSPDDASACFIFVLGLIFLTVVAPIWIVAHYLDALAPQPAACRRADERALGELYEAARRMEARLAALERVLDAEAPGWRTPHGRMTMWTDHAHPPLSRSRARHRRRRLRRHRRLFRRRARSPCGIAFVVGAVRVLRAGGARLCRAGHRAAEAAAGALCRAARTRRSGAASRPRPTTRLPRLRRRFGDLETRLRAMERRVTSREFDLRRKFRDLC